MTDSLPRLAAALADRYRIERELGAGGMATVYLARDLKHERDVAIKVLRPELAAIIGAERFLREIKTIATLQHPHILGLIDSGEVQGTAYYVMPFVEGESLRDRLAREKQLPIADAVRIATEVANALDYAHRHGVIHRDIKPENILLHDGSALVADFGIALAASRSESGSRMTETGMSLGTPHYMSPEQAMGERDITAKADVYALGCVLYEMLTGEPPFTGPTAQAIVARVMTEEPRSITLQRRTVPPEVEAAALTALAKLPADRFAGAAQFADALAGRGPALWHAGAGNRATQTPTRPAHRLLAVLPWLLTAIAVVGAAWGWLRARDAANRPIERQYISLGDSAQFEPKFGPALALSPDGSRLVFIGDSLGRLWIKRRDALDPTLNSGTVQATNPTFSPDGRWIAYIADRKLNKVQVDGGASIVLGDSAGGPYGGVAWMDDGTLIYSSLSQLGLRRVSSAGGPVTVALADTVFKGLGIGNPTPLPHSRGVIFQACNSGCVRMSLYVLDLGTGRSKLLFNDVAAGWYLPSGLLFWIRTDGVGLVAPFDLATLEVKGAGSPVLQGIQGNLALVQLAWSASGTLVYGIGGVDNQIVTLQRLDRQGRPHPADSSWSGEFNSLALSPDGKRVAVGASTPGAGLNIWIKQLDKGPFTRLTFSGLDRRPAWSPDGHEVAFVRDSGSGGDIYARSADGAGKDRLVAHLDRALQEVTWSPDGRWLVVRTETGTTGSGDILAVRTSGDPTPVPLVETSFTELHPALSPDGRWLAYTSNEGGANEVYVRPFPNSNAGRWQISNGGGFSPVWSADGKELYYLDATGHLISAEIRAGPGLAFAVPERRTLFDALPYAFNPYHQGFDVTRDGRFLFMGALAPAGPATTRLVQVQNWFADLRARLANR